MPTTKAQVTGHKFLLRRVQHGLVLGDVRMIHDPLAARRRAAIFGLVAVVFLALGSGLLAWLQPEPQPGEAPVVRSQAGQLFVRIDNTYHPVANLASARIIAGKAAVAQAVGDKYLAQARLGSPVGIVDAPGYLDPHPRVGGDAGTWAACYAGAAEPRSESLTAIGATPVAAGEIVVVANVPAQDLAATAALVSAGGRQWIVSAQGRTLLPEEASMQGRILRRALGIGPDTRAWELPEELLGAYRELSPFTFPAAPPEILDTGSRQWARTPEGVSALTELQAELLQGAGASRVPASAEEIARYGDIDPFFNLPPAAPELLADTDRWLCADASGGAAALAPVGGTVELSGSAVADRFAGLAAGGVGVDSGHGYHVVEATGQRHEVESAETLSSLGIEASSRVPWSLVRLLPAGSPLSRQEALKATY